MKVKVTLYVAGKVFDEYCEVANYEDGKRTALARNPTARFESHPLRTKTYSQEFS